MVQGCWCRAAGAGAKVQVQTCCYCSGSGAVGADTTILVQRWCSKVVQQGGAKKVVQVQRLEVAQSIDV